MNGQSQQRNRKRGRILKIVLVITLILITAGSVVIFYQSSVTKNVHTYIYDLPYQPGTTHRIVQGYGGLYSHYETAALDFAMPIGTTICAAREGKVYSYRDDSNEGGFGSEFKSRANYLMIQHPDGTFGCYWHLQQNGVLVKRGYVKKGQPIALSGATGMTVQPHLHFSVKARLNYSKDAFVRTKFLTTDGVMLLKNWHRYRRP